jgi:hypothetical protein
MTANFILLLLALFCFALGAIDAKVPRVNLPSLGWAFVVLAWLVAPR